jgi:hypothetical protein
MNEPRYLTSTALNVVFWRELRQARDHESGVDIIRAVHEGPLHCSRYGCKQHGGPGCGRRAR